MWKTVLLIALYIMESLGELAPFFQINTNSINYLYEVGWVSSTKYAMQIIRNEEDKGIHLYDDVGQFIPHHSTNAMVSIDY